MCACVCVLVNDCIVAEMMCEWSLGIQYRIAWCTAQGGMRGCAICGKKVREESHYTQLVSSMISRPARLGCKGHPHIYIYTCTFKDEQICIEKKSALLSATFCCKGVVEQRCTVNGVCMRCFPIEFSPFHPFPRVCAATISLPFPSIGCWTVVLFSSIYSCFV
jgi:hypothetical protein